MKKEKENEKVIRPDRKKLKITIAILILAALFIAELYLMINQPKNLLALGVIALVMLCFIYWIVDLAFKLQNEKEDKREKEYENIYKSQKISYMLMKENFEDLYVSIQDISENSEVPVDDLIQAQKAIAKVTINRSKENANALMNSNDKLIEKMFMFEEKLKNIETTVENNKVTGLDEMADKLARRQQEIMSSVDGVEYTLKNDIKQVVEGLQQQIATMPSGITAPVQENVPVAMDEIPVSAPIAEEAPVNTSSIQVPSVEELLKEKTPVEKMMSEDDLDALLQEINAITEVEETEPQTETPIEDIFSELQEVTDEGDFLDDVLQDIPEDIMMEAPEILDKKELDEINKLLADADLGNIEPAVEETVPEPIAEPEPVAEPEPISEPTIDLPVSNDPNHVMTPDEIAALFGASNEEPATEPELEPEKPAMPDLSDPNHVMTPDEIAALLANL